MNKAIEEIIRFQTDRGLDKQAYDPLNEATSVVEEILESMELTVEKEARPLLRAAINVFVFTLLEDGIADLDNTIGDISYSKADAHVDQIVFNIGALLKLGFDPIKALEQGGLEINSREGSMVDGKFEKDLTPEAKAKWYKADYSKCILE